MRKRIAIAGHSEEGLGLIPLLEANPAVEVCAIYTPDPGAAHAGLACVDPHLASRAAALVTSDLEAVLRIPGLTAVVDADLPRDAASLLDEAPERGVQVTTPLIAKLLYAFGPIDGTRKPDLLQALSELLESYNLTVDRDGLLSRILQIAVGSTGADRGSLMLHDPDADLLRADVAIGIEKEVLPKIRVRPGEGISGRAFSERRPILLRGKADHERYSIARERSDVAAAISAPLVHGDRTLGVLNLSHATDVDAFDQEDLDFVANLARVDAKIITRAEEYHRLLADSASLREQRELREILSAPAPLARRLSRAARYTVDALGAGSCQLYVHDAEHAALVLRGSSEPDAPLAGMRLSSETGLCSWAAREREPLVMTSPIGTATACVAVLPLTARGQRLGLLAFDGVLARARPAELRERVTSLAASLGAVLHDLLRELHMARETRRSATLSELAARLGSARESSDLHRIVVTSASGLVDAHHAVLRLLDAEGRLVVRAYSGGASREQQPHLLELESSLALACLREHAPLRVPSLHGEGWSGLGLEASPGLVAPVRHAGHAVGTLSVLGRAADGRLLTDGFDAEDQTALERLAEQAHASLMSLEERERSHTHERFDVLTGLPNGVQLGERLEQEIARCGAGRALIVVSVHLPALDELCAWMEVSAAAKLIRALASDLRACVREFDVVARTGGDSFQLLLPEPDRDATAVIGDVARHLRAAVQREIGPDAPEAFPMRFGYAVYPDDGSTARSLMDACTRPRVTSD